jgi:hypothetical protein
VTLGRALDKALGKKGKTGEVVVKKGGAEAVVDVADADRLGITVKRVKVSHGKDRDVAEEAAALPERLKALPEPVEPVEVDPGLGGAILRTGREKMRNREFFQVDVGKRDVEVRRYRVERDGRREVDFTMTRDKLGELIDELEG